MVTSCMTAHNTSSGLFRPWSDARRIYSLDILWSEGPRVRRTLHATVAARIHSAQTLRNRCNCANVNLVSPSWWFPCLHATSSSDCTSRTKQLPTVRLLAAVEEVEQALYESLVGNLATSGSQEALLPLHAHAHMHMQQVISNSQHSLHDHESSSAGLNRI